MQGVWGRNILGTVGWRLMRQYQKLMWYHAVVAHLLWAALVSAQRTSSFHPGKPMYDTSGNQIDAHGGGMLSYNNTFYWYGSARKDHPDPPGNDKGVNLYSSKDLYKWTFEVYCCSCSRPPSLHNTVVRHSAVMQR